MGSRRDAKMFHAKGQRTQRDVGMFCREFAMGSTFHLGSPWEVYVMQSEILSIGSSFGTLKMAKSGHRVLVLI